MDFFLVRHGEAAPDQGDARRPLSARGRSQVEKVGRAAAAKGITVAAILHSDKLRAEETAEILGRALAPGDGIREITGLRPDDDPLIARAELEAADAPLMLVGHLPHLARLAGLLLAGDSETQAVEFSTATIACLSRSAGKWRLEWTIAP